MTRVPLLLSNVDMILFFFNQFNWEIMVRVSITEFTAHKLTEW